MKNYDSNNNLQRQSLAIIVIVIAILNFAYLYKINYITPILQENVQDTAGTVSNLVDNFCRQTYAFAHGSLSFLNDASNLEVLENPYDVDQRSNTFYLFDTSYYKGKYYSYYTVLPIIFIMLPIYLLTEKFINLAFVNLLILTLTTFIASKLYRFIIEEYIQKIPYFLYILGFVTIIFGSNMFMLMRGLKYDIAVSCGMLFITATVYMLMLLKKTK